MSAMVLVSLAHPPSADRFQSLSPRGPTVDIVSPNDPSRLQVRRIQQCQKWHLHRTGLVSRRPSGVCIPILFTLVPVSAPLEDFATELSTRVDVS